MHTRRFNLRHLIGAVAALGVAVLLAGPANAQTEGPTAVAARTGIIHQDCDRLSLRDTGELFEFRAWCRISDRNYEKRHTFTDLAAEIGNEDGNLTWGQSGFHRSCEGIRLDAEHDKVMLMAACNRCRTYESEGDCTAYEQRETSLDLNDYYLVDGDGQLRVK